MTRKSLVLLSWLLVVAFVVGACASPTAQPTEVATEPPTEVPTEEPTEPAVDEEPTEVPTEVPTEAAESLGLPAPLDGMTWEEIVAAADGQEVTWWMWGGSTIANEWANGWLADKLKEYYNITMKQVPVSGPTEFINQVRDEKAAGKDTGGAVDIMWINGENFRTMKEADLLYGPWAEAVPSGQYYDWSDPALANDFGYPVEGYEMPWGSAQSAVVYDSARLPEPPRDMAAFVQWIKDNPGRFTYPALPDFTGSLAVRHFCYHAAGGYEPLLGEFDPELFEEEFAACWDLLNELEPYLWRKGTTYPTGSAELQDLLANAQIDLYMSYGGAAIKADVDEGILPETARPYIFESGMIGNTNYIAVAYNAAHPAAAVVTANYITGLEAQFYYRVDMLGSFPPFDIGTLPPEYQQKFQDFVEDLGPYTIPPDVREERKLPELQAEWLTAIEGAWEEKVQRQ